MIKEDILQKYQENDFFKEGVEKLGVKADVLLDHLAEICITVHGRNEIRRLYKNPSMVEKLQKESEVYENFSRDYDNVAKKLADQKDKEKPVAGKDTIEDVKRILETIRDFDSKIDKTDDKDQAKRWTKNRNAEAKRLQSYADRFDLSGINGIDD